MTRWEPLQPSPVAVNALAAQEAAMEYFRFHLGLFNCICVRCNETTAHPPISVSRNAFKSLHFKGKEKQLSVFQNLLSLPRLLTVFLASRFPFCV